MTVTVHRFNRATDRGVAVDPIARRLGVTRGSFYWHFRDRDALLTAALEKWEQEATVAFIAELADTEEPADRLEHLLRGALTSDEISGLEPAIVAHADHPVVNAVLERVTERRVDYLTELFGDLGLEAPDARRRAVVAYAAYLGWVELRRTAPAIVPETATSDNATSRAALDHLLALIKPPPRRHRGPAHVPTACTPPH